MPTHSGFHTTTTFGTVTNGDNLNFGTLTPGSVGEMNAAGKIPIATGVAFPGVQIVCNTLTAGAGISIANGAGTITITSLSAPVPWIDSAGGALALDTGYFATAAAVYTLSAGVANGDVVEIVDFVGGGVVVTAQNGDLIRISNTSSIANGTATSTQLGDALRLIYRLVGQVWVCVPGAAGNWILA